MLPPIANNFIGGESISKVVDTSTELQTKHNITPIVNRLGEHYQNEEPVHNVTNEYSELVETLGDKDGSYAISVKPTQLGLDISTDLFSASCREILSVAEENDVFVWIDMEGPETVEETVKEFRELQRDGFTSSVGLCFQANMPETHKQIKELAEVEPNSNIRLVKGAYSSSETIEREKVNRRYKNMFNFARTSLTGIVAAGTHDDDLLDYVLPQVGARDTTADIQIQMLRGVRTEKQEKLASEYDVAQYIPYGSEWISYTYRRIKERPRNVF